MPGWITHLMIADGVLERFPGLNRRGFCVGSIAPDCNVENKDWTSFTPPREVTHWMQGKRKSMADADAFRRAHLQGTQENMDSFEKYAFLLGYYAHLAADAAYEAMIHDTDRIQAAWKRVQANEALNARSAGLNADWKSIKRLIPKPDRLREANRVESEYLRGHPRSGYWTEILPLRDFPQYLEYLPPGCIERKIEIMGLPPQDDGQPAAFLAVSREEFRAFAAETTERVIGMLEPLVIPE